MTSLADARRVHVVGVGGAGMSAVARLLVERGTTVSGSDVNDSPRLDELRRHGVLVVLGHDPELAASAQVVLWSPAVRGDDPELVKARERGATLVTRAELFGQLAELGEVIGLCGTHGKTTATSMMVHIAHAAQMDVGWLVGADVVGVGANGHWGDEGLVVEVDESYGTFSTMTPHALGLLNVEADHLDHYGSLAALEAAFSQLVARTSGPVVVWHDDAGAARVATSRDDVITVGTLDSTWLVRDVELERRGSTFILAGPEHTLSLCLAVTGAHNVANAAVVAVLALALGWPAAAIVEGLSNFAGAPRRFEFRGRWRGADVYEDYAHLPGEIRATLRATRAVGYERPLVIFQPHRVTRTLALADAFADAFDGAAQLVVTDLYDAGEANPSGVSGEIVADAVRQRHPETTVTYVGALRNAVVAAEQIARGNTFDVVLVLGAGDVPTIIDALVAP
ncbi:MAG TPA: UDP-N-acetylmuramate--L-alanine ligase [Acidimicrobiales bacterium]|nr:UDP-N-acetylmuramate--L-alanine ligase [Acidimicrobiales bacterium]